MNPSRQQPGQYTQPPINQISASEVASVGRGIGYFIAFGALFFSLVFMLIGAVFGSALLTQKSYTSTANATVLTNTASTSTTAGTSNSPPQTITNCDIHYSFAVSGKKYNGDTSKSTNGISSDCGYSQGSIISIKYDPSDPTKNAGSGKGGAIVGVAFFLIGLVTFVASVVGIIKIRRTNKNNRSATNAQIELITNGFQELGDYWHPRHLTQAEAEETIADINKRLEAQRSHTGIVNNTAAQSPPPAPSQQLPPSPVPPATTQPNSSTNNGQQPPQNNM